MNDTIVALEHFTEPELALFAISNERSASRFRALRDHLEEGCRPCAQVVKTYRGLTTESPPSTTEIMCVRADPTWIRPRRVVSVVGMRAGMLPDIKLICAAGPYELELRVREFANPSRLELSGQVVRADGVHEPVPELPLSLIGMTDDSLLVEGRTDVSGEFGLTLPRCGPLGLRLGLGHDAPCIAVWEGRA